MATVEIFFCWRRAIQRPSAKTAAGRPIRQARRTVGPGSQGRPVAQHPPEPAQDSTATTIAHRFILYRLVHYEVEASDLAKQQITVAKVYPTPGAWDSHAHRSRYTIQVSLNNFTFIHPRVHPSRRIHYRELFPPSESPTRTGGRPHRRVRLIGGNLAIEDGPFSNHHSLLPLSFHKANSFHPRTVIGITPSRCSVGISVSFHLSPPQVCWAKTKSDMP
ncbi:hypothetical protein MAPG_09153 [Magnaporthiopsis poae ATCC 64411]|uniref:Uncharacterized protein n=1 Tax=Magnaporthiopsis poae (strain ATCC 64411 / 73-15) TaxID=644358 RepID=A0A0C4E974_MAGP6|nr:hypothetical protein MAPG_09153 [Magnaporthiopsis poae ATCC 64411]